MSQTLHTVTASLATPLIRHYLTCNKDEETFTLLRRVFTALIRHCKGPEQLSAISDTIVKQYAETLTSADEEQKRRILEVASSLPAPG